MQADVLDNDSSNAMINHVGASIPDKDIKLIAGLFRMNLGT